MPMNLLMMFMMGNSIGLFPIMMLGMMVYRPVQALLSYKEGEPSTSSWFVHQCAWHCIYSTGCVSVGRLCHNRAQ